MNSDKTRILTPTSGKSITDLLQQDNKPESSLIAECLRHTITKYSRMKNHDGSTTPQEEVDGLQILGILIGSPSSPMYVCYIVDHYMGKATGEPLFSILAST